MFETQNAGNNGFAPWDVDGTVPKINRGRISAGIGTGMAEKVPGSFDYQTKRPGDIANALFWRHKSKGKDALPRGVVGSYSFAFAGVGFKPTGVFGKNPGVIPLTVWHPYQNSKRELDRDFDGRSDVTMMTGAYGGEIPGGVEAMIVASTGHGERHPFGLTPGGPLVAHHEGPVPPKFSRHAFDIDANGNLDPSRHQGIHSIWRIRGWLESFCKNVPVPDPKYAYTLPPAQLAGGYTIMLNGTKSEGDNTGYMPITFTSRDATASHESSGPLRPATDIHLLGVTSDGRPLNAAAIDTAAYYTNGQMNFDGPLEFIFQKYIPPSRGPHPYVVELRMDNDKKHGFLCGQRNNMWRWETWIPVTETPPCFGASADIPVDSQGNPDRITESSPAVFTHSSYEGNGLIFKPRTDLLAGQPVKQRGKFARV